MLENAALFTPPSTTIRVHARAEEEVVTLAVEDDGPGIPPDQQEGIFERHPRPDSGDDGPGLGLFISRKIVEAHGGRIWLESPTSGTGGARFLFSLPIMPEPSEPATSPLPHSAPAAESRTVLLIEADPEMASLIRAILKDHGYEQQYAPDGRSALDLLAAREPDLVLLDPQLPRMDGLTVCRTIRRWSRVPVLVLTSKTATEDLVAAVEAGADDVLSKPFEAAELLARMQALLRRAERWQGRSSPAPLGGEGLTIDERRMTVRKNGDPLDLTPTEFELLAFLAQHQHQVLTHEQLIDHLWPAGQGSRHQLFVHINRLRSKIEPDPKNPRYVVTRWGVGYAFLPTHHPNR